MSLPCPALPEAGAGSAALRLAEPFVDTVFDGWTPERLAALPLLPGAESLAGTEDTGIPLPPGALAYFIELRAGMHGLVMLELLGHLHPFNGNGAALHAAAMHRTSDATDALAARLDD